MSQSITFQLQLYYRFNFLSNRTQAATFAQWLQCGVYITRFHQGHQSSSVKRNDYFLAIDFSFHHQVVSVVGESSYWKKFWGLRLVLTNWRFPSQILSTTYLWMENQLITAPNSSSSRAQSVPIGSIHFLYFECVSSLPAQSPM